MRIKQHFFSQIDRAPFNTMIRIDNSKIDNLDPFNPNGVIEILLDIELDKREPGCRREGGEVDITTVRPDSFG